MENAQWREDADAWNVLEPFETRILLEYRLSLSGWGYATKAVGTYEQRVHGLPLPVYHLITNVSDVVFRVLDYLAETDGRVHPTDYVSKLSLARGDLAAAIDRPRVRRAAVAFLDPFADSVTGAALARLARQDLDDVDHSPPYIAIVAAALALGCMADDEFDEALDVVSSYVDAYAEHFGDEEDDD
ncbi:MAG: hypothetical protein WC732_08735 [Candidatus Omnitrophota bacterium]